MGPSPRAQRALAMDESDELDVALRHLFEAYDIDESGELSRDEFVKIEMRVSYETGEMYNMGSGARMTMADKDQRRPASGGAGSFRTREEEHSSRSA